ncbi:alpha/beta hydrolase [Brachybacterium sp. FME24]|uniref:alpha/beta hydrolase n=1 Tax=Brachybacterium sp. FME24 TaxID=2742605 RepID=UPI0018681DF8|nr:alpha/beta hydrolase fold domain-containing protein [Brachybacterium sp. FME24]
MSIVRTLRILASQRPSMPSRAVAAPARVERRRHGHVPVTWIDAHLAATATIVHLHGGGHVRGESPSHWNWLEEVGRRSGAAVAMIHYRMPPKNPFPAAIEDVLRALDAMGEESLLRPGRWVLSGDSSGGGLALAVAQSLAPAGGDTPALLMLESPWADLTAQIREESELGTAARLYAGAVPAENPRISPLLGDLGSLPPVHLVTGGGDEIVEDSRRLHAGILAAGGASEYVEMPGEGHDVAVFGEGPGAQAARRAQIEAVRLGLGLRASV